jgi:hypothetical protein
MFRNVLRGAGFRKVLLLVLGLTFPAAPSLEAANKGRVARFVVRHPWAPPWKCSFRPRLGEELTVQSGLFHAGDRTIAPAAQLPCFLQPPGRQRSAPFLPANPTASGTRARGPRVAPPIAARSWLT